MNFHSNRRISEGEANDALDHRAPRTRTTLWDKEAIRPRLEALRAPVQATEDLAPLTFKWLARMPAANRPQALPRRFPRIANRIAYLWQSPLQCERYLDELMMDERGGRQGFPADVAADIAALKLYFLKHVGATRRDIWGERVSRRG